MKIKTVKRHKNARGTDDQHWDDDAWGCYSTEFALVDEKYNQLAILTSCRSYIVDCIWGKEKEDAGKDGDLDICNFVYHYKDTPFDLGCTRLLLKMKDKESVRVFDRKLVYLHRKEKIAGLEPTVISKVRGQPLMRLAEGDPEWQTVGWKMSLYTFYLKIMSLKSRKSLRRGTYGDSVYFKDLVNKKHHNEKKFLAQIRNPYFSTPRTNGDNHGHVGFVSIMDNNANGNLRKEILGV